MNYTKGEWQTEEGYSNIYITAFQKDKRKHSAVADIPVSNDNCRDNAHLIAAAPDMYEAIKLLQAALTEYRLQDIKKRYSLCVADAAASNAIAKAEGKNG